MTEIKYTPSPTSERFHNDRSSVKCLMGPVGCLSSNHEVMTRDGWIGIADWSGQDILVSDRSGNTFFEQPMRYISAPCDWLYRFKFNDAIMEVSSDHNVFYRNDKGNSPRFAKGPATQLAVSQGIGLPDWLGMGWYIPSYEGNNINIDDGYTFERFTPLDAMQYCFEVSTSLFVTRLNGRSFITGNSGKSVACVMECFFHAMNIPPIRGIRESRIGVVRSTYSELKETTIKTWEEWLGGIGKFRYDSPIKFSADFPLPDGTTVKMRVSFFPLDQPKDVTRLRSAEYTMLWINEGSLVETDFLGDIAGRLRYQARQYGDEIKAGRLTEPPYRPIIIDTNPPSTAHWIYKKFEQEKLAGYRMFKQPPGLLKTADGEYIPNPLAENVGSYDIGYQYYYNQMVGMTQDKINVLVLGQYGSTFEGKPVYESSWSHREHVSDEPLLYNRSLPLIVGMDWGMSPAASFMQMSPTGQLLILDELAPHDVTLDQFIVEHLRPKLMNRFPGASPMIIGDPAGAQRSSLSTHNAFEIVRSYGYMVDAAPTQDPVMRREAVTHFLLRRSHNGPTLLVSRQHCPVTIDGFDGGYKFAKLAAGLGHRVVPDKNSFSHCFVGDTMVRTNQGPKRIDQISTGDKVVTPWGLRSVTAVMSRSAKEVVKVSDGRREVVCTPNHRFFELTGRRRIDMNHGQIITEDTPSWVARAITLASNTKDCFISLQKGANGIRATAEQYGPPESQSNALAPFAAGNMNLKEELSEGSVRRSVSPPRGVRRAWTMLKSSVTYVVNGLVQTSTTHVSPATIADILVYDLTVEGQHCYYANGFLVSNCHDAIQYGALYYYGDIINQNKRRARQAAAQPTVRRSFA